MTRINLDGIVGWDILPANVARQIDEAEGDIEIEMNSPGGYITDGLAIMNKIRSYKNGKIKAKITFAASMMTQIASACDEVECYENAVYMIHNAQGGGYGDHHKVKKVASRLESFTNMLANNYVNQSGISKEEILKMMDEETYLFGQDIVDKGFASAVIESGESEVDEESAKALAHDMFNNCIEKISKKDEDHEKVAAILEEFKNESTKTDNIKEKDGTINRSNKNEEGEPMAFTQEDIDKAVASALSSDRSRVAAIIDIECSDEMKLKFINSDKSAGDLALDVLAMQKKEKESMKDDFEGAAKSADVNVEDPQEEMSDESKKEKEAMEALDNL